MQFGGAWLDDSGYSWFVVWVEHTGELYAIREVLRREVLASGPPPW